MLIDLDVVTSDEIAGKLKAVYLGSIQIERPDQLARYRVRNLKTSNNLIGPCGVGTRMGSCSVERGSAREREKEREQA